MKERQTTGNSNALQTRVSDNVGVEAMGAIAPTAKKSWGNAPKSFP